MSYTHSCLKCKVSYLSDDPDPYLCDRCIQDRRAVAAAIDEKFNKIVREPVESELQRFDKLNKGFKGFVNSRDLGI